MTYSIEHVYAELHESTAIVGKDRVVHAEYSASGHLPILRPGRLSVFVQALYYTQPGGVPPAGSKPPPPVEHKLSMTTQIFSPDGNLFTADQVTLADLERFRNLRQYSAIPWRYKTWGASAPMDASHGLLVTDGNATVKITIEEAVTQQSPGPLVSSSGGTATKQVFSFDLFRVGEVVAEARLFNGAISPTGTLKLIDPNGATVASGSKGTLRCPVTLRDLDKSRDVSGKVRPWSLEFMTSEPKLIASVTATVVATARVPLSMLQQRIDFLLGATGKNLRVYGEDKNGYALGRVEILDEFAAETIDVHMTDSLRKVLKDNPQDPGVDTTSIQKDVPYSVAHLKQDLLGYDLTVDVGAVRVKAITIKVGASTQIQPSIPAISVAVAVDGEIDVDIEGFTLVSLAVKDGSLSLEVGLELDNTGSIALRYWFPGDNPIDIDVQWDAAAALGHITDGLSTLGINGLTDLVDIYVRRKITDGLQDIVKKAVLSAPHILAMLLGGYFTLRSLRLENAALVFDYLAPIEPDPKPSPRYIGVIGRALTQPAPGQWQVDPPSLGDTWAAGNLANIDHVVVVMMENRSFDHVLGYRQLIGDAEGDGGYRDLIDFLYDQNYPVTLLRNSGIKPNAAGLKTRFPAQVGHKLLDVAEQLAEKLQTSFGTAVISPKGFISNFASRVTPGLLAEDILGTYDGNDLAFYRFLAENYAYCERYFSAHPGPTLPNRMYSLGGENQYDRLGEAILDNSISDNFSLSRALNIFDLLTRKNVSWRVYESFPSVTMLRMFARYVGDDVNIRRFDGLKADIKAGNLPSVTFIDPAMHHGPENDDHPVADMLDGQRFLKTIYDALRGNAGLWLKTLLIITYDEHGGFYDHVVPPAAEVRSLPTVVSHTPTSSFDAPMIIPYGVRVPTFVVSPWVPAGKGPGITLDHCSILKTILARFCSATKPFLSDRVNASLTFNSFLTQREPRISGIPPSPILPDLARPAGQAIQTRPISSRALRAGDVDFHDLTGMLARTLGRP